MSWPSGLKRTTVSMPSVFNSAYAAGTGCAPRYRCASTWPKLSMPVIAALAGDALAARSALFRFAANAKGAFPKTSSRTNRTVKWRSFPAPGKAEARLRLVEFVAFNVNLGSCAGGLRTRWDAEALSIPEMGTGAGDLVHDIGPSGHRGGPAVTSNNQRRPLTEFAADVIHSALCSAPAETAEGTPPPVWSE